MKALVIGPDAPWRLAAREVEPPTPAAGEALVAIAAFSVNRGELSLLARRDDGWRPGQDIAGVVLEPAADGSGPAPGTRVVGMVEQGGWSEQVTVPTSRLAALPSRVSMEQAATLPIAGLTALRTLRLGGPLLGRRVLITGATGGVGTLHVQLAAAAGAQVTAVSARADAASRLTKLGAQQVIAGIGDTDGVFDLIEESVGGESLTAAIGAIAPGGTIVVFGNSSAQPTPVSIYNFIGHEGARLVTYFSYAVRADIATDLTSLLDLEAYSAGTKIAITTGVSP